MKDLYYASSYGNIYYQVIGTGPTIIFLHGWGKSSETFKEIANKVQGKKVLIDFPGFGLSDEPEMPLRIKDYVKCLKELIDHLHLNNYIIVGHSFGGRVAIKFTSSYPGQVRHLILVNSAGLRKHNIKYFITIIKYKIKKGSYRLLSKKRYQSLLSQSGSDDYQRATYIMRGTLKKVVKEDLKKDLKKIKVKTSLIAGFYDQTVPYQDAITMHKLLRFSKVYLFFKSGHFAYIDEEAKFIKIIEQKLGESNGDMAIYN